MANFRRNRPKENQTQRNGEWSHPPVEKGRYKFSTVANKRRAMSASVDIDDTEYEYDPLDTSLFEPKPKKKPPLNRQQRAVKRAQTLARNQEWREWWNSHILLRPKQEAPKEEFDLGKEPELIQPKRKRK